MQASRRCVLAGALASLSLPSLAQEAFPSRPLRLIVPFAPGGPVDILGRPVAERMSEALGQPVVFENRPGANGIVGAQVVATARPDGHTLLLTTGSFVGNVAFSPQPLPYDAFKDIAPVTLVADGTGMMLVGNTRLPPTLPALVALSKTKPGGLSTAMTGIGNITHLAIEQFREFTGGQMLEVVIPGTGPSLTEIMAGNIDATFSTIPPARPLVADGRLRPYGYTGRARPMMLPQVPTMKELGFPEWELIGMLGLWTTGGTPADRVAKVQQAVVAALRDPAIVKLYNEGEFTPSGMPPEQFADYLQKELAMQLRVARRVGLAAR